MDVCPICLIEMDMISFEDPRDHTETCIQLECKHAFHTRCIIQTLGVINKKCPCCNPEKDASTELKREGLVRELIRKVKKNDEVSILLKEVEESIKENRETLKILTNDIKAFIEKRKTELEFDKKRSYLLKCLANVRRVTIKIGKKTDPAIVGALVTSDGWHYRRGTRYERVFYGAPKAWLLARLKIPYFRMSLY